jgi:BirA family transcriptional regulator, biotin operon repressor / biotin---[acetyl-CoA-carboxylase] ligase
MQLGTPLIRLDSTASTMEEVDRHARAGAVEGLTVVARHQTAGRGRAGRQWLDSGDASLLGSVLLRPTLPLERLGPLPLVIGLAIANALDPETGVELLLKWPNDLMGRHGKVGGILVTSRVAGERPDWMTAGFGINVNQAPADLPEKGSSLFLESGRTFDVVSMLQPLLHSLDQRYHDFIRNSGSWDRDEWMRRACYVGERVSMLAADRSYEGVFRGVDQAGAALLELDDGSIKTIAAGDLVRGPTAPVE